MFDKETVEKWISDNAEKIRQGKALLELVNKVEFKVLNFRLSIYTVGNMIRADLKTDEEIKTNDKG